MPNDSFIAPSAVFTRPFMPDVHNSAECAAVAKKKADFVFFIDTTGSMLPYINSVRTNLSAFSLYLASYDIDVRLAVVEFRDITADGVDSTVIHMFDGGSMWTSDASAVESTLASLTVDGGGDNPETPTHAMQEFLNNYADFDYNDGHFAFLLTDATAKGRADDHRAISDDAKMPDLADITGILRISGIHTSVVSETINKYHYEELYTETGGKFINIRSSNYYELMLDIANWVIEYMDTDGDGLPDVWETEGVDVDGDGSIDVDLPAMGADPNSPDIFVYYDWTYKTLNAVDFWIIKIPVNIDFKPSSKSLEFVEKQFKAHDIRLHFIEGKAINLNDNVFDLGNNCRNWNSFAAANFPSKYYTVARYCIFLNKFSHPNLESIYHTGITETAPGQFLIVARGAGTHGLTSSMLDEVETAVVFMHELGHSLGLKHGGDTDDNYKPNYLSIMNYLYAISGLVTSDVNERINYSEYELPALNEQNINETKGLDPKALTSKIRSVTLGAKWKLENSLLGSDEEKPVDTYYEPAPTPSRSYKGIAGVPVDLNGNGTIETVTTADFFIKRYSGDAELPHTNNEIIPQSINDWKHLIFKGGAIGGLGMAMSGDMPVLISMDTSTPLIEELTLEKAKKLNMLGNPDDCKISSIAPNILYSSISKQNIRVTVENMFNSETTAEIEVKSDLLSETFALSVDLSGNESKDIFIPVKSSVEAGNYTVEYSLKCANNLENAGTLTVYVVANDPISVRVGETFTIDGAAFGVYTAVIEDTSIATLNGTQIYGVKTGQTFIILLDEYNDTVCTIPVYVIDSIAPESDDSEPDTISDDAEVPSFKSNSGGCNAINVSLYTLLSGMIFFMYRRKK